MISERHTDALGSINSLRGQLQTFENARFLTDTKVEAASLLPIALPVRELQLDAPVLA